MSWDLTVRAEPGTLGLTLYQYTKSETTHSHMWGCHMLSWTINEPHLPYKTGLDVMQSHPLRRTRFGQYQASSAALGWPGDGDCYLMHRMQSGGWPYSKVGRDSSKAPSLRAAVLRAAVFRSKILRSDWSSRVIDACVRARAYRGTGGTGSIVNKTQGKQCKANSACLKAVCA